MDPAAGAPEPVRNWVRTRLNMGQKLGQNHDGTSSVLDGLSSWTSDPVEKFCLPTAQLLFIHVLVLVPLVFTPEQNPAAVSVVLTVTRSMFPDFKGLLQNRTG